MDEVINLTTQLDETWMSSLSNSSDGMSFDDQAGHIFFEFVLHGVVLNLISVVRLLIPLYNYYSLCYSYSQHSSVVAYWVSVQRDTGSNRSGGENFSSFLFKFDLCVYK